MAKTRSDVSRSAKLRFGRIWKASINSRGELRSEEKSHACFFGTTDTPAFRWQPEESCDDQKSPILCLFDTHGLDVMERTHVSPQRADTKGESEDRPHGKRLQRCENNRAGSHLFHKPPHPVLLMQSSSHGKVVPGNDFREEAVDGMPLFHGGNKFLALLVVPQGRGLFREYFLQRAAANQRRGGEKKPAHRSA